MNELRFKTNMMCDGCIAKVGPHLDKLTDRANWSVDLESADKVLSIRSNDLRAEDVLDTVRQTGYQIEKLD